MANQEPVKTGDMGTLKVYVEGEPHNENLDGVILNRPAPRGGAFLISRRVPREVWREMKAAGAWYMSEDDLEELDMFTSEPGWRYSLAALEVLLRHGYSLEIRGGVVSTINDLHALFTEEAKAEWRAQQRREREEQERRKKEEQERRQAEMEEDARRYREWLGELSRHGMPLTNEDKRAAVRRLLANHPDWSSREIARRVGCSHPTVESVRREMTEEAAASGKVYQMPEGRVVQRGDQTYVYTAPQTERVPVWQLENTVRGYLKGVGDRDAQIAFLEHIRSDRYRFPDDLDALLPTPRSKRDVIQALNNVLEQLRQANAVASVDAKPVATLVEDEVDRIKGLLVAEDWQGLRRALGDVDDAWMYLSAALTSIYTAVNLDDMRAASRCLTAAVLMSPLQKGDRLCRECGGALLLIRRRGQKVHICRECGREGGEDGSG